MELRKICKGECKRFRVKKPSMGSRYGSGQGRCQTCDVWLDHNGVHLKDGSQASPGSLGWFCNCCNFRVRQKPRHLEYKQKLKGISREDVSMDTQNVDFSHWNNYRAGLLRDLGRAISKNNVKKSLLDYRKFLPKGHTTSMEHEFGVDFGILINLANTIDPPNRISMIVEFERVRHKIGKTPTRNDMEIYSNIHPSVYDDEFESWEKMLNRLGYDPWYREDKSDIPHDLENIGEDKEHVPDHDICSKDMLDDLRNWLVKYYKELDLNHEHLEYSHEEMFYRLEKYLDLLPKDSKMRLRDLL